MALPAESPREHASFRFHVLRSWTHVWVTLDCEECKVQRTPLSSPSQAGNQNKISTWKSELAFVQIFFLAELFFSKPHTLICCLLELP